MVIIITTFENNFINVIIIMRKLFLSFSGDSSKMLDVSLVTTDYSYYTCLGDYDPIKEDLVTDNSNLEVSY